MHTLLSRTLMLTALALAAGGCDSGNVTYPTPPAIVTEAFTGTLGQGVVVTHRFEVPLQGSVAAQIVAVDPADAAVMGFSLGSWDGTTCAPILRTTEGRLGFLLAGIALPSSMCVQLFDVGNYAEGTAVNYTVSVAHPTIVTTQ